MVGREVNDDDGDYGGKETVDGEDDNDNDDDEDAGTSKETATLGGGGGGRGGRGVRGGEEQGEQGLEETKFLRVGWRGGCRRGFSPEKAGDAIDDWPGFWCGGDPQHLLDLPD